LSDELKELGFIDTDSIDHSLTDILLVNGDYEIFVLTSSLFWNDCFDQTVRTISVRPDTEISPLPTIYNLRSFVSQGVTTITWSANQSDIEDCIFGLWFSPVPFFEEATNGSDLIQRSGNSECLNGRFPANATVWYYPTQTEYRTTFHQNAPSYLTVAAMRTGNEPELGQIHELFLDWSTTPLRAPDDVMVFDTPLPAIDPNIDTMHEDDSMLFRWTSS